ncbi:MAG: histidine kinase [Bacteroidota bacterium]
MNRIDRRIKYLGFDDRYFILVGVLVLSTVTYILFNNQIFKSSGAEILFNWLICLFLSIANWLIAREVLILLRKKYPKLEDLKKRGILFFFALILIVLSTDFFGGQLLAWFLGGSYHPMNRFRVVLPVVIISVMTISMYEVVYHYVLLREALKKQEEAKRNVVQSQLNALRNQARPHFLFNTLNTLRDIIDQNSKETAKTFVDKLSDVYRYILESGNDHLVSLEDELQFAESYIHIQKERFGENLILDWEIPSIWRSSLIVPMSIQLLLENAIKHNVVSRLKPLTIHVEAKGDTLTVTNTIQAKLTQERSTQMGLQNIVKRYELLGDARPVILNDGIQFSVQLPLLAPIQPKS